MKVYVASKLNHAEMWKNYRANWAPEIEVISTWIDNYDPDDLGVNTEFAAGWSQNLIEVRSCDVVLCYGERSDQLRGALVEAGAALGLGKPVIGVGDSESFGTWKHHPNVYWFPTMIGARSRLGMWMSTRNTLAL